MKCLVYGWLIDDRPGQANGPPNRPGSAQPFQPPQRCIRFAR